MNYLEKGCQMPSDISFKKDKTTTELLKDVRKLDIYYTFMKKGSSKGHCITYLKILN